MKINKHKKSDDKNLFHWDILSLGEIFDGGITGTSVVSESRIRENGEAGILKISAVSQGKFLPNEHKAITEEIRENLSAFPLKDTVLVSRANTQERVGESAYIENDYPDLFLPDKLWMFKVKDSSRDLTRFYSYVIQSDWFRQKVSDKATGTSGSMKNISRKNFLDNLVPRPPYFDQKNITEILVCVDNAIAITEKLITAKRRLKQGLMQKLLTGKVRFREFSSQNWEAHLLENICECFSGGTPSRSISAYFSGDIPWIKSGEINREFIDFTEENISQEAIENSSSKLVKSGTILVAMYGATAGKVAMTNINAAINQAILAIVPSQGIDPYFLYYYFVYFMKKVARKVQGGQPNLNAGIIKRTTIFLPSIEEQLAISNLLKLVDTEIKYSENIKLFYETQKQGLMQQLLTGKIRVQTP
ncbi:restriction endonuclease subunit S [Pseudanabaena sp. ABRG5-3]|uniref:restriction endonuclease subunit S n=1 Tax=Pseudanabaena sp. ABRG5-3 TaxID=685565 RepID=UPI0013A66E79|nr:restriction endonuclease subunit S [Pseudanabaena sp. ABRG5-3]